MYAPIIGLFAHCEATADRVKYVANASYTKAIVGHGAIPLLIPPDQPPGTVNQIVETLDGLLIPGGADIAPDRYAEMPHPRLGQVDHELDTVELPITACAYEQNLPILGICRGIQTLAVALGGSLYQDLPSQVPGLRHEVRDLGRSHRPHDITITPGSRLAEILGQESIAVNSLHHQAVRTVPEGLSVTARSEDDMIEAVEAPSKHWVLAVQCHPEELWNTTAPDFTRLFASFVAAAGDRATSRR